MRTGFVVVRRGAAVLLLALVLLPLGAGVASAHVVGGLKPSTSVAEIVSVDPTIAGLQVTVIEAGARLRIDNHTDSPVEVVPPAGQPRLGEPVVAVGQTARWVDRRITAAANGDRPTGDRRSWVVPARVGGRTVLIHGVQIWPLPPLAVWWWLATIAAAALSTVVGLLVVRRHRPRIAGGFALIACAMVAADIIHAMGSAVVVDDKSFLSAAFGAAGVALLAWPMAIAGAVLTGAGNRFGTLVCGVAAAYILLATAFDVVGFSDAVLPFGWGPDLDRTSTVLTLGPSIGLLITGFAALRRLGPDLSSDDLWRHPITDIDP